MPATISTWNLKDAETEKKVRAAVEELFKKYPDDWRVGIREGINNETWEIKVTAADGRKNAAKKAEITSRQWYAV
jgi:ribosomal protein L23